MSIGWVENRGGQVSGVKKFHHQPQKYFRSQQQPFQNQKVWPHSVFNLPTPYKSAETETAVATFNKAFSTQQHTMANFKNTLLSQKAVSHEQKPRVIFFKSPSSTHFAQKYFPQRQPSQYSEGLARPCFELLAPFSHGVP